MAPEKPSKPAGGSASLANYTRSQQDAFQKALKEYEAKKAAAKAARDSLKDLRKRAREEARETKGPGRRVFRALVLYAIKQDKVVTAIDALKTSLGVTDEQITAMMVAASKKKAEGKKEKKEKKGSPKTS